MGPQNLIWEIKKKNFFFNIKWFNTWTGYYFFQHGSINWTYIQFGGTKVHQLHSSPSKLAFLPLPLRMRSFSHLNNVVSNSSIFYADSVIVLIFGLTNYLFIFLWLCETVLFGLWRKVRNSFLDNIKAFFFF